MSTKNREFSSVQEDAEKNKYRCGEDIQKEFESYEYSEAGSENPEWRKDQFESEFYPEIDRSSGKHRKNQSWYEKYDEMDRKDRSGWQHRRDRKHDKHNQGDRQ